MKVFTIKEPVFKVGAFIRSGLFLSGVSNIHESALRSGYRERPPAIRRNDDDLISRPVASGMVMRICEDHGIPVVAYHPDGSIGDETAANLLEYFCTQALRKRR